MTDENAQPDQPTAPIAPAPPTGWALPDPGPQQPGQQLPPQQFPPAPAWQHPGPPAAYAPTGYPGSGGPGGPVPVGKIRSTGLCILLSIVTLGIYQYIWFFSVHDEMKRHSREGIGGGVALLLTLLVGIVMPYLTSSEVGRLYEVRGQPKPVSGVTGLWYFPGILLLVGPIVWFVKTNGAINDYWRSCGVQ